MTAMLDQHAGTAQILFGADLNVNVVAQYPASLTQGHSASAMYDILSKPISDYSLAYHVPQKSGPVIHQIVSKVAGTSSQEQQLHQTSASPRLCCNIWKSLSKHVPSAPASSLAAGFSVWRHELAAKTTCSALTLQVLWPKVSASSALGHPAQWQHCI